MQQSTQTQQNNQQPTGKSRRGFASMDKERHKLVSSKGGKSERKQFINPRDSFRSSYEGL